ncbi:MAG: lysophospholipid acyltransferase family protein [Sulfurospirillaceae bacterium]|nr:lysophospholipid acyltransferase family protein [Sulfurospirillaceae bacterium]MDD2825844.1 lysophospholipid acyltransferase family protein [Sulfurospirillaceae bacterium]
MKILSKIRGIYTIIEFVVTVLIVIVLMYIFRNSTYRIRQTWAKMQMFLMRFSITQIGHTDEKATLLVLNHQSLIDIVAFEAIYPKDLCWIAKKEIQDIPLFGHIINAPKMIAIDRKDKRSIIKMLKVSQERINEGRVIAMFPEGTRGDGTTLLKFQSGAKIMAEKLNMIVQPAIILGARYVFDSKNLDAHNGEVRIIYLDPIHPKEDEQWYEKMYNSMNERLQIELANTSSNR